MRAMGPGSVSSLLKIGLDVFWFALIAATCAATLVALIVLVVPQLPAEYTIPSRDAAGALVEVPISRVLLARNIGWLGVNFAVLLFIVRGLRRVFLTLVAGDPFQPENVKRLRGVGLALAVLASLNILGWALGPRFLPGLTRPSIGWPDLTAWFSVLVVFVLAEVFREGARLRRDAELTI